MIVDINPMHVQSIIQLFTNCICVCVYSWRLVLNKGVQSCQGRIQDFGKGGGGGVRVTVKY